ncbi:MAG TPA: ROK family protein, partial [Candidatus Omnitrophota bacterium]|nr:ROK family protein [Candidatus Omnitrophota bacterium]
MVLLVPVAVFVTLASFRAWKEKRNGAKADMAASARAKDDEVEHSRRRFLKAMAGLTATVIVGDPVLKSLRRWWKALNMFEAWDFYKANPEVARFLDRWQAVGGGRITEYNVHHHLNKALHGLEVVSRLQRQIVESAARNKVDAYLLASIIFYEQADLKPEEEASDAFKSMAVGTTSVGVAQMWPTHLRWLFKDINGIPVQLLSDRTLALKLMEDDAFAVEAAARYIRYLMNLGAQKGVNVRTWESHDAIVVMGASYTGTPFTKRILEHKKPPFDLKHYLETYEHGSPEMRALDAVLYGHAVAKAYELFLEVNRAGYKGRYNIRLGYHPALTVPSSRPTNPAVLSKERAKTTAPMAARAFSLFAAAVLGIAVESAASAQSTGANKGLPQQGMESISQEHARQKPASNTTQSAGLEQVARDYYQQREALRIFSVGTVPNGLTDGSWEKKYNAFTGYVKDIAVVVLGWILSALVWMKSHKVLTAAAVLALFGLRGWKNRRAERKRIAEFERSLRSSYWSDRGMNSSVLSSEEWAQNQKALAESRQKWEGKPVLALFQRFNGNAQAQDDIRSALWYVRRQCCDFLMSSKTVYIRFLVEQNNVHDPELACLVCDALGLARNETLRGLPYYAVPDYLLASELLSRIERSVLAIRDFERAQAASGPDTNSAVLSAVSTEEGVDVSFDKHDVGFTTYKVTMDKGLNAAERQRQAAVRVYDLLMNNLAQRIIIHNAGDDFAGIVEEFGKIDEKGRIRENIRILFGKDLEFEQTGVSAEGRDVPNRILWSAKETLALDETAVVVGVNIGSTYTRAAVMKGKAILSKNSRIIWNPSKEHKSWARAENYDQFIDGLEAFIRQTVEEAGLKMEDVQAVGVGTVGFVRNGEILTRANVTRAMSDEEFAKARSLKTDLSRRLGGIPVAVEMDSKVAALGERVGSGLSNAFIVKLGTAMAGKTIAANGDITDNFEEIRQVMVKTDRNAHPNGPTGVRGTLRSYGSTEAFPVLSQEVMGEALDYSDVLKMYAEDPQGKAKEILELMGRYLARGFAKLQSIHGFTTIVLAGKNLEGAHGQVIIDSLKDTLKREFPLLDITIQMSAADIDYAVAVGAGYMASIENSRRKRFEALGAVYGLTQREMDVVASIKTRFGIDVLPVPGFFARLRYRLFGTAADIRSQLFVRNEIVTEDYFDVLVSDLELAGRQLLWRAALQAGSNDLRDVLRAVRLHNARLALRQIRESLDTDSLLADADPALVAQLAEALEDLLAAAEQKLPSYFERPYLRAPQQNIEVYSMVVPIPMITQAVKAVVGGVTAIWDHYFGLPYYIRQVERIEEKLGLRAPRSSYAVHFFRRNDAIGADFEIHPYAQFDHAERQSVSLGEGMREIRKKTIARLEQKPDMPVIIRIDGRPGNRKSHSIRILKQGLNTHVKPQEIALIEVNEYKRPNLWSYDIEGFYRDYNALIASGKYKVILVEGTVIELYVPGRLPQGDLSIYIESIEPRRMEYLLNGDDKERLEYFLRYHPYHNVLLRYRTDVARRNADVVIDTYLIPEEGLTGQHRILFVDDAAKKLEEGRYFTVGQLNEERLSAHDRQAILLGQHRIGEAIEWLLRRGLVRPSLAVRLNLFTSNGFVAGADDRNIGLASTILTTPDLSDEERAAVLIFNLFVLFNSLETSVEGLEHQPIKKNIMANTAAVYEAIRYLLPAVEQEFGSSALSDGLAKL